ncbi:3-deoxy-manno-octulosonate cytidylyltransferase [Thermoflavifilum thermophilum]|uniref:3-deoxy-manno-octulosonate cytidylyltransferase n=1 Tax=Thermoflavifilum thermophilum TaxID=1393122 RepID=A0A1I7NJT6_9BACT|nr:3-deoxy-manno-octulosonate cytidylyltransferase [Thermoflavifilum thermophilum]SFV34869.1 3-deoxy-manno-octulosonate cytidylyltransferase (CMP-KDO synthetase) [Thermoflavifilum thermophilum]
MRVVAIIPARYASTRFPGKPLVDIAGKSMIRRVYERVSAAAGIQEVWVATDDERIYNHVKSWNGQVMMTAVHHQSGTERCAELAGRLDPAPDIVVNVQGDEPFIQQAHLHALVACFNDQEVMIASLMKRILNPEELMSPHLPKVIVNQQNDALYFSRQPVPYLRDVPQSEWLAHHMYYKHVGIYAFRMHVLQELVRLPATPLEQAEKLEQLRWLEHGYRIRMAVTHAEQFAIDTPEDLQRCLERLDELEANM